MPKPKPPTFTIGDPVIVRATARRVKPFEERVYPPAVEATEAEIHGTRDDGYRCWVSDRVEGPPQLGVIVGQTTKQDGWYTPAYGGSYTDDYEPASWTTARVHTMWLVRFHLRGPECYAFEEALAPCEVAPGWRLPWHTVQGWGTDEASNRVRAELRREMQNWPRNAKGRWLKRQ